MRLATMAAMLPSASWARAGSSNGTSRAYSLTWLANITATRRPASALIRMPAFSTAFHAASTASRCCGSISRASRGGRPKKAWSKRSTPSR